MHRIHSSSWPWPVPCRGLSISTAVVLLFLASCGGDGAGSGGGSPTAPEPVDPPPPPPGIALALSVSSLTVQAGASGEVGLTVTRSGGFAGAVTLAVTGVPEGVSAAPAAPSASGNTVTSALEVQVDAGRSPGSATLTLRASGEGVTDATAELALVITPGDPGGVGPDAVLDYSSCVDALRPVWVAVQHEGGPWTRIHGDQHLYTFPVTTDRVGVATVFHPGTGTQTHVQFQLREEITAVPQVFCPERRGELKAHPFQVAGWGEGDLANVSLGGATTALSHPTATGTLIEVQGGPGALVGYRFALDGGAGERAVIRRNVDEADGAHLGTVDFNGSEAFEPEVVTTSVSGGGSDGILAGMSYLTGSACHTSPLWAQGIPSTGPTVQLRGIPQDRQEAGDFHQAYVTAIRDGSSTRTVLESFRVLAPRTFTLGAPLDSPEVTGLPGGYLRHRFVFPVPGDYNGAAGFQVIEAGTQRVMIVFASIPWLGGPLADLSTPDLGDADGWNADWAPGVGGSGTWVATAVGNNLDAGSSCQEDGWIRSAARPGTF